MNLGASAIITYSSSKEAPWLSKIENLAQSWRMADFFGGIDVYGTRGGG